MADSKRLYIVLISVHGLIRGQNLELGRDADTGGQTKYVVELAQVLSQHPDVERVDLFTRLVNDHKVSPDYAEPVEMLNDRARIIRINCGPRRYLRKEVLWPYLDVFADELLRHVRQSGRMPDVIHSHYADAGYVGCRVAGWLGVPLIHTGHSLGRVKRQRMLDNGSKPEAIEEQYHFKTRIEAEETTLASAAVVIASTHQEVDDQYRVYDNYSPHRMAVIPPGVDTKRFYPIKILDQPPPIFQDLSRFLNQPYKPFILCLSRPVPRKNVSALVKVYGEDRELQERANLVLILGNRTDISKMEASPRQVFGELFSLIDRYDLYGRVAYPKAHSSDDVPDLYRLAAQQQGIFINPALTEPFGLTLIEAAACGLPVLATADGGPRDILGNCDNGLLFDPLDPKDIRRALHAAFADQVQWQTWAANGLKGIETHYSWKSHVENYLAKIETLAQKSVISILSPRRTEPEIWATPASAAPPSVSTSRNRLLDLDRLLISDIDNTLIGDKDALIALMEEIAKHPGMGFGVATGRHIESTLMVLEEWGVPLPDVLITSVGSEIHYGPQLVPDTSWQQHINYRWQPQRVQQVMNNMAGIVLQPKVNQRRHKISYIVDPAAAPEIDQVLRYLRQQKLQVRGIFSHEQFLDILPLRASKGDALRYFALKWGYPLKKLLVAGDSGNDEQMLTGNTLAVVVGNHSPELEKLRDRSDIYFADGHYSWGILEALRHYNF
ncbi:HAD-IIB family hydrolase [Candidatus Synechococcus calcipolaris G9]|uniref:sucrose-phosphate synthase n=1 Tax=Candidatus Synechococcus calcipolaris G9 TaxID=1497997 RepID=A0ABT6F2H5_9SYNE|nr:HAD-IIB family hydrolase [Candidatus Synechococcus calcipolaris]MDG2992065.1 HAD-IIB family hydrolase [Candidatus Synechococcus calcipolaris G9]